ncbi:hypothetical protein GCM10023231_01240 [Olivibacter ginsenosidimutans]|uniref:Crp/Fnr family transcriptional regulator n=2 Tax=Olivibacter ginsenosidimutans TaxID=1176537 RepID=A0ABP9ABN1_9SPHI
MHVPPEASAYMATHCQVKHYLRNSIFSYPNDDPKPYWCFVLEGLAVGIHVEADGKETVRWLAVPYSYFTGTIHPFSTRQNTAIIEFWTESVILLIPNECIAFAQQHYPAISELMQILKQQQISRLRKYVQLFQYKDNFDRYCFFQKNLAEIAEHTNNRQQAIFLQMSNGTFYMQKQKYVHQK